MKIDWNSWEILPIFKLIQKLGGIDDAEMRHVFNLGIGMILIVDKNNIDKVISACEGYNPRVIGEIG
jgi:phosphoribosylformylglycinamidine cyclo-ligase